MSTAELLAYLAEELDGEPAVGQASSLLPGQVERASSLLPPAGGVQQSVRRIQRFLAANAEKGRHAVVAIDEAQLVRDPATFEALRLLLNFEPGGTPALTLLLVGQPSLLPVINRMPQWEERLAVKCLLRPFTQPETESYVEHRLRAAGSPRPIVEPDAVPTLQELTHGIARQINRLCDLALLIGYAEEQQTLGPGHFEAVCRELVAVTPE